jgi:hypothetical protein
VIAGVVIVTNPNIGEQKLIGLIDGKPMTR